MDKTKSGGLRWVVRDSNGSLICVRMQKIEKKWNIKSLEAKAILEGMKSISNTCIQNRICFEVESDAAKSCKRHQWRVRKPGGAEEPDGCHGFNSFSLRIWCLSPLLEKHQQSSSLCCSTYLLHFFWIVPEDLPCVGKILTRFFKNIYITNGRCYHFCLDIFFFLTT